MKIQVGKTYVDKIGCHVHIVYKVKHGDAAHPFVGVVDWSACSPESADKAETIDQYAADGRADFAHCRDYDLVRLKPRRRRANRKISLEGRKS